MDDVHFQRIDREDYERIAKALVAYDHICFRNAERRNKGAREVSDLQERWLAEGDRFSRSQGDDGGDGLVDGAYREVDDFLDGEAWHELAWWLAERECKRLSADCADREARELVTDRLYHRIMEEFIEHGIDRLVLPGLSGEGMTPRRVAEALRSIRRQTRSLTSQTRNLKPET